MKNTKLPTWNLNDLFKNERDPKIAQILKSSSQRAGAFAKKYRGKLKPDPKLLLSALKEFESIEQDAVKPLLYAQLLFSESSAEPSRGAFMQYTRSQYLHIHHDLLFFELEITAFTEKDLKKLATAPLLSNYRHYLGVLLLSKPHRLSEKEEKILSDKGMTSSGAFVRLFDQEMAAKKFILPDGKKTIVVSETEVLSQLYSPNRSVREAAAKSLTQGLQEEATRLTYITNILAEDKAIEDKYRNFKTPEASRHLSNEITQGMVDSMSDVVTGNYKLVQEFYGIKKKLLKVKELYDYDRYAPITTQVTQIPYAKAQEMVLAAFYKFDKGYGDIAAKFFKNNWVDVADRPGKRGGAFCSFVTPDLHPYVFMNYSGSMRDVFTLAHELGHAIHAYLMREQSFVNFDTPLTIAETASVFAEMLLFDYIKNSLTKKSDLLTLYVGKIENVFATVFRQIAMYKFEQDVHHAHKEHGELSSAALNALWRARQTDMFGKSVTLTPGYDCWWSYIPHFLHTPFYVYAYSFGELLTLSLYAQYKEQGEKFIPKYLTLLKTGGSKTPAELLKPLNINLEKKAFWQDGVGMIREMVEHLEELI